MCHIMLLQRKLLHKHNAFLKENYIIHHPLEICDMVIR